MKEREKEAPGWGTVLDPPELRVGVVAMVSDGSDMNLLKEGSWALIGVGRVPIVYMKVTSVGRGSRDLDNRPPLRGRKPSEKLPRVEILPTLIQLAGPRSPSGSPPPGPAHGPPARALGKQVRAGPAARGRPAQRLTEYKFLS